jgi:hypothetical protein
MKWLLLIACIGCQSGETGAPAEARKATGATTNEYAGDIERLCNAMTLSGADKLPQGERMMPLAQWMAKALKTPEGKAFMLKTNQLPRGPEHVEALMSEAKRVGLEDCPLAEYWR